MQGQFYLGYRYINKQGLNLEIVEYKDNKNILVRFPCGMIKKITGVGIKKGRPFDSSIGMPKIGEKYPSANGGFVEIIKVYNKTKVRVRWEDGYESDKYYDQIKKGVNYHPIHTKLKSGQIFNTKSGRKVKVIEHISAVKIIVEFEDGARNTVTKSNLEKGNVGHPSSGIVVGQEFTTNSGWNGVVKEYIDPLNAIVKWQDGSESCEIPKHILNGDIKPLCQPSVCGIGYFGSGEYVPASYKTGKKAPHYIFKSWQRMLTRCYSEAEQQKDKSASYKGCLVTEDWHNFQNYIAWYKSQPSWEDETLQIDKDLLGNGRLYSSENCCLVPIEINIFLSGLVNLDRKLPLGVQYIRPRTSGSKEGYVAKSSEHGNDVYLGYYNTPEEAYEVYKKYKENRAKELASIYVDKINSKAYHALMNFSVEDWIRNHTV